MFKRTYFIKALAVVKEPEFKEGDYRFSVTKGSLPENLELTQDGIIRNKVDDRDVHYDFLVEVKSLFPSPGMAIDKVTNRINELYPDREILIKAFNRV